MTKLLTVLLKSHFCLTESKLIQILQNTKKSDMVMV